MERYNKYLVLKIADIEKYLSDEKQLKLDALVTCIRVGRLNDGKRDQEYVCVAADWPMYEQVWGMVEAFVDGKPNEIEQLTAKVAELEAEKKELQALLDFDNARLDQIEDELEDVEYLGPFVEGIKVLKTQLVAAQEEWNQCSGLLDDAHRSIEMLEDQLAKAEQRVAEWQPISTAPKDAFVLLAGPSGYTTIKTVFATGRMCSDYHKGRWIDHANDDLTDWGFEPTHWMPLPKAPANGASS